MAPNGQTAYHQHGQPPYNHPIPMASSQVPSGTFQPGTKIQVGSHRVVIQKYLSEGGFAHVYLVKLPKPVDGTDLAVLKRVAVADKDSLRGMRTEVETMKRLKGHKPIVTYIDSHASEIKGGGYEVFLLMEYCDGGGLIDFMNTRLQHRLTEPEILKIFADIAEGVACMHYLKPALLHRDLKVENVLITGHGSSKRFKVCDFGSAAPPKPAPSSVVECRLLDEDVQRHTTMQYRSPEMVDVYRKQPINEKSDIWALGVLLYKLCYYTTPFEEQGQLAILNASFKYPNHPVFSDRLKKLIGAMLRENLASRPNIYQVLKEACAMQGRESSLTDIYSSSERPSSRPRDQPASREYSSSPAKVGAVFAPPVEEEKSLPTVVPMRRGRPTTAAAASSKQSPHQPSPSPMRVASGDPFAALDTTTPAQVATEDFTSRFPSLDQFSLLHDHGNKFDFDSSTKAVPSSVQPAKTVDPRVSERLADEAFASSARSSPGLRSASRPQSVTPILSPPVASPPTTVTSKSPPKETSRAQSIISGNPELRAISETGSRYVSTGTSTSDLPSEKNNSLTSVPFSVKSDAVHSRSSSLARAVQNSVRQQQQPTVETKPPQVSQPVPFAIDAIPPRAPLVHAPTPQRSLLQPDYDELPASASRRQRPVSASYETSTVDFLREKETSGRSAQPSPRLTPQPVPSPGLAAPPAQEGELPEPNAAELDKERDSDKEFARSGPAKNRLSGKFSSAFKRFEKTQSDVPSSPPISSSPPKTAFSQAQKPVKPYLFHNDDDEEEDMTPEQRRELEKAQLEEEERRVEAAQAEYRKRTAEQGSSSAQIPLPRSIGGVSRAVSIQNRVQSLLSESQQPPSVQRTAEGYGKYSDAATAASVVAKLPPSQVAAIPRKPLAISKTRTDIDMSGGNLAGVAAQNTTGPAPGRPIAGAGPKPKSRPPAPKKPIHLNSIPTGGRPPSPQKRVASSRLEQLIAADLPGQPVLDMTEQEKDDYLQDFSKRFPSLGAIEMVEREIGAEGGSGRV